MEKKTNIEILKELRKITSLGFEECRQVLETANYDLTVALQLLKKKNLELSSTSDNKKNFGIVKISQRGEKIVAFALKCETDFVALNQKFQVAAEKLANILLDDFDHLKNQKELQEKVKVREILNEISAVFGESIVIEDYHFIIKQKAEKFGLYTHHNKQVGAIVVLQEGNEENAYELALQVIANQPKFLSSTTVPNNVLAEKKQQITEQIKQENQEKPTKIIEKIINGKLDKYLTEICFLEQNNFLQPEKKIKDYLVENKIQIKEFLLLKI